MHWFCFHFWVFVMFFLWCPMFYITELLLVGWLFAQSQVLWRLWLLLFFYFDSFRTMRWKVVPNLTGFIEHKLKDFWISFTYDHACSPYTSGVVQLFEWWLHFRTWFRSILRFVSLSSAIYIREICCLSLLSNLWSQKIDNIKIIHAATSVVSLSFAFMSFLHFISIY